VSDFTFEGLTPALILDAIESLDIYVSSGLLALNSYENRVYQFVTEDHGRMVVKFYRPNRWSTAQILEEHEFSLELHALGLPIVAPLKFNGESLHTFCGYRFALFLSMGGREFEVDNLEQLEGMGSLIGQIHAKSAKKSFTHRLGISVAEFLHDPAHALKHSELVPFHLHLPFFTILEQVCTLAESKYTAAVANITQIRLHGDCHPSNILWRDGPIFVDLDDCRTGPAIQDLWMMLAGDINQQQIQLETLINAYKKFTPFNPSELALIEPLRAMRMVHYMAWLSKRWEDPAFPRAFPWFGEDKYWENQILSLKEQFSALQQPSIHLPSF
jgi:Ser/Thr protein kinase RdoA (MazF antagonist)